MANKHTIRYKSTDKYVVINDNDPDLIPIVISLPEPPDEKLIDGYGLPADEQFFHRLDIPESLKKIELQAIESLSEQAGRNANKTITLYKIQKKFWDILEGDSEKYASEIAFIRRFWWHRLHGYWFYNHGKPTYITNWHFYYLNCWTMDVKGGENRPQYRDRDRKEYLFKWYSLTCTETFANVDEDGNAIPNDDGYYEMVDLCMRLCFGNIQSKNRRSGNTNKGLSDGCEMTTRTIGTDGMIIYSHTGDDAEKHFKGKMMPGFMSIPMWIRPLCTSGNGASQLKFEGQSNDYQAEVLTTRISYAETGSDKAVDGQKLVYALLDESGKVTLHDVAKRWDVVKHCLSQGDGREIHGWSYHPSTVAEMSEGGAAYRVLSQDSMFYKRMPSGQTTSGLFTIFIPADEGLDGFIDPWGMSIKDKIEPYQAKLGFKQTANDYLQQERDALLKNGSPEAMRSYRLKKKLFPLKYGDSWHGGDGDIGFPLEEIDKRQAELRTLNTVKRGNLKWLANVFGGEVYFEEDNEHGRFEISKDPNPVYTNQKTRIEFYSVFANAVIPMWQPRYPKASVIGADPYKFKNKQQDLMSRMVKGTNQSKLSRGGMGGLECVSESDLLKPMSKWENYGFFMSYCFRSNSDEFNEDLLKAAIYWGSMVYPEGNVGNVEAYFIEKGFGGYLIYDLDKNGQRKSNAGVQNIDTSKQTLFTLSKEYLDARASQERHASYLSECSRIKGLEEMTIYDRFTAHGLALMGAQSLFPARIAAMAEQSSDISDFIETWSY